MPTYDELKELELQTKLDVKLLIQSHIDKSKLKQLNLQFNNFVLGKFTDKVKLDIKKYNE